MKRIFIVVLLFKTFFCYCQREIWEMDSLVIIKGDTAININSNKIKNKSIKDGKLYFIGSKHTSEKKDLLTKGVYEIKDSLSNGLSITYSNDDRFYLLNYFKSDKEEGIQLEFSQNIKKWLLISVFDNNKLITTFYVNKHFKIIKRIYFNNGNPYRIIFLNRHARIKGDFNITDSEKKVDWTEYKYWKRKNRNEGK